MCAFTICDLLIIKGDTGHGCLFDMHGGVFSLGGMCIYRIGRELDLIVTRIFGKSENKLIIRACRSVIGNKLIVLGSACYGEVLLVYDRFCNIG